MKWRLLLGLFMVMALESSAQKFVAEKGVITFFSDAPIEDILATNAKAISIFNVQSGEIAFSVPIHEFQFAKKLMQEHFNEKYMESEKYPKAVFSGKILNLNTDQTTIQQVKANGKLTIHGVTHDVEFDGTVLMNDKITMKSKFNVKLADYNIKIPQLVFQNIAEEVEVTVDITYKSQ